MSVRNIIAAIIGVLPIRIVRIFLWRALLGYSIDYSARIGWGNFICCKEISIKKAQIGHFNRIFVDFLSMENGSEIRRLNNIKLINQFIMDEDSQIISRNSFIGLHKNEYENKDNCSFKIGKKSLITIANSVDVTDTVTIGDNVVFGGKDTQLWTHGFDINRNMITGPVTIGDNVYIGSRSTLCQGITIVPNTVIGAATCVPGSINESGFYVSNQLIRKGNIKEYSQKELL